MKMTSNMVKTLRRWTALTQVEFAKYMCVSYSLVTKWEGGTRIPSGPALKLLRKMWRLYKADEAAEQAAKGKADGN